MMVMLIIMKSDSGRFRLKVQFIHDLLLWSIP